MNMSGLPVTAPAKSSHPFRYADVGVTATAKEFAGIYRGKHCHPPDFAFMIDRALAAGVEKLLLTGMSTSDVDFNLDIARSRPGQCFVTIGVHPYHANEIANDPGCLDRLKIAVENAISEEHPAVVAFGELGLDYDRTEHASTEAQVSAFRAQLDLIVQEGWDLPLFLHCRAAFDDFVEIVTPYLPKMPRSGLVHSFVGSTAQMQELVKLGLEVSVNGFSFKTRESLDMVAAIPLEKLHLETDAPWGEIKSTSEVATLYLKNAPALPAIKKKDKWDAVAMVKERNESCTISRVVFVVAGLKGLPVEDVADAAWRNSVRLFKLDR